MAAAAVHSLSIHGKEAVQQAIEGAQAALGTAKGPLADEPEQISGYLHKVRGAPTARAVVVVSHRARRSGGPRGLALL